MEEFCLTPSLKTASPSCLRISPRYESFYKNNVRLSQKFSKWFKRTVKTVLAFALVLQVFALLILVASPALHHALHHDSNDLDHGCIVTLFLKGQLCEVAVTPVIALVAVYLLYAVLVPDHRPRLVFQYQFTDSRAPPRF